LMNLPVDYRRESRFEQDLIQREWPELLHYPFNDAIAVNTTRRARFRAVAAARRTGAAARFVVREPRAVARAIQRGSARVVARSMR
jgi:hypothetical protein